MGRAAVGGVVLFSALYTSLFLNDYDDDFLSRRPPLCMGRGSVFADPAQVRTALGNLCTTVGGAKAGSLVKNGSCLIFSGEKSSIVGVSGGLIALFGACGVGMNVASTRGTSA